MTNSLYVVALISGGKDSLYSILHCLEAGHKVVALANLFPHCPRPDHLLSEGENEETDDIDSFMYQTVGHRVIPLYEDALGLPLYRRVISGTAKQTHKDYATPITSAEFQDETEDLLPLLESVLNHHPEVNAVSTGAILSTYQRTRVESVAIRLGLVPLSYLWQYPFLPPASGPSHSITGLLDDMASVGCEARIIKIATGGLDDNMLWTDVCDLRTRNKLVSGMQRFVEGDIDALKAAVLGEGGEFETLAINGPPPLWKKRIVVDAAANSIIRGEGGTSSVRLGPAKIVPNVYHNTAERTSPRIPSLLDADFRTVQDLCMARLHRSSSAVGLIPGQHQTTPPFSFRPTIALSPRTVYISNLQFPLSISSSELRDSIQSAFSSISSTEQELFNIDLFSSTVFATLLVRSMSSFSAVNELWTSLFSSKPNPPARVTISCGDLLPPSICFSISLIVDRGPRTARDGLHVQSWSYWAPANIGPYSQSIAVPLKTESSTSTQEEIVYIAGQIPLHPQTMTLHSGSFIESAVLSLQHLWRIGVVQKVNWWLYGVCFLARDSDSSSIVEKAEIAYQIWRDIHLETSKSLLPNDEDEEEEAEEDVTIDAWDLKYGLHQSHLSSSTKPIVGHSRRHQIPNRDILSGETTPPMPPPFLAVEIESLPRDACIEWQSLGYRSRLPSSSVITTTAFSSTSSSSSPPSSSPYKTTTHITTLSARSTTTTTSAPSPSPPLHQSALITLSSPTTTTTTTTPVSASTLTTTLTTTLTAPHLLSSPLQITHVTVYACRDLLPTSPPTTSTQQPPIKPTDLTDTIRSSLRHTHQHDGNETTTPEDVAVTVIPCRRIFSSSAWSAINSTGREEEEEEEEAEAQVAMAMAMVVRLE